MALVFNPKKTYISIRKNRNIAYFIIARKRIKLVVLQSEEETRKEIKFHTVQTLSAIAQNSWNGPSCAIIIETTEHLDEIKTLLRKLITKK